MWKSMQQHEEAVSGFISDIENRPPKRAAILKINVENIENSERYTQFDIIESEKTKGEIFVSPDIAICEECKEEMFDPKNRRYLHPFINCTCCGPRLTILDSLPYDRERTSMKEFPMCPDCAKEYNAPATRRYDAQPVCCNECGPEVYLIGREERAEKQSLMREKRLPGAELLQSRESEDFIFAAMLRMKQQFGNFASLNVVR